MNPLSEILGFIAVMDFSDPKTIASKLFENFSNELDKVEQQRFNKFVEQYMETNKNLLEDIIYKCDNPMEKFMAISSFTKTIYYYYSYRN